MKRRSGDPCDDLDGDLGVLSNQRLYLVKLSHLAQFFQSLLELLASGRILSDHRDELDRVQLRLVLHIV